MKPKRRILGKQKSNKNCIQKKWKNKVQFHPKEEEEDVETLQRKKKQKKKKLIKRKEKEEMKRILK